MFSEERTPQRSQPCVLALPWPRNSLGESSPVSLGIGSLPANKANDEIQGQCHSQGQVGENEVSGYRRPIPFPFAVWDLQTSELPRPADFYVGGTATHSTHPGCWSVFVSPASLPTYFALFIK